MSLIESPLIEFLRARFTEEERRVNEIPQWERTNSARGEGWGTRGDCPLCDHYMFDGTEVVTAEAYWNHYEIIHRRTFVLAEIAAKRKILERAEFHIWQSDRAAEDADGRIHGVAMGLSMALEYLALPYAGHPDYDEEWTP